MADRGVSPVIGMMLVAAIAVLLLGTLQTTAVPTWNEDIEFTHLRESESTFKTLHDTLQNVAGNGIERSITVRLAPEYPQRFVLRNPPNPSGQLRTTSAGTVSIANASVSGDAGDFWDGSTKTYSTRSITLAPEYGYVDNFERFVVENSVVATQYDQAAVTQTTQNLVDGRRITLVMINGSLQRSGVGTTNVELKPVSAPTNAIAIRNDTGPITLTVPTLLGPETWDDLLAEENASVEGGHVITHSVETGDPLNELTITLETGVTYELRLAKIGVGNRIDTTEEPTYVMEVAGDNQTVFVGGSAELAVEVRDRFNTPQSGVDVTFRTLEGRGEFRNGENTTTITTDEDGQATAQFVPRSPDRTVIQASIAGGDVPVERSNFTLQVEVPPSTGGQSAGIILVETDLGAGNANNQVEMTFENVRSSDKEVTDVGITVFYDQQRGQGVDPVKNATIDGDIDIEIGGTFTDTSQDPITLVGSTRTTVTAEFFNINNDPFDVDQGDFYQITFIYGDGTVATYLVVPR